MAAEARPLWEGGLLFLATIRRDGSPRLHPITPIVIAGALHVAITERSPKWRDLDRDPRCVLHALPGPRDDELMLRCRARDAERRREEIRKAADHVVRDSDRLFELDIEQLDLGHWEHVGQPGTYPIRHRWTPGRTVQIQP